MWKCFGDCEFRTQNKLCFKRQVLDADHVKWLFVASTLVNPLQTPAAAQSPVLPGRCICTHWQVLLPKPSCKFAAHFYR